jgi:hypothetical protein
MSHISSYTFSVRHHVPDFTGTIVASAQQQMTCLRKETNSLNTLVVAIPRVKPFFWYEAVMLFLPQITWSFNKATTSRRIHVRTIKVIN